MSKLALTLSSGFVNAFLAQAEVVEAEAESLLSQAGISPSSVREARGRITEEQFAVLYRQMVVRFDDELPNLLAYRVKGGAMKLAGLSVIGAATMGAAIHRHTQFLRLMIHDFEVRLICGDDNSTVIIKELGDGPRCKSMAVVMTLKVIHGFASWLIGHELPLLRADFAFARPAYAEDFQNLFPGPISFDQDVSKLVFDSSLLNLRVQRKVGDLKLFLARQPRDWICGSYIEHLVTHQVRDYFMRHDLGKVTIDQVAKALNVSNRTLCRRLETENTSFQLAKDDLRRDLAVDRLTNTPASISQIAFELGFGDTSSFHRAFRTWTGMTPSTYRDGAQA